MLMLSALFMIRIAYETRAYSQPTLVSFASMMVSSRSSSGIGAVPLTDALLFKLVLAFSVSPNGDAG